MTKGDLPQHIWGRPLKPVALGTSFLMLVLIYFNIMDTGRLGDTFFAHTVAALAGAAFAALQMGWWLKNQNLAEWGLLLAAGVYSARSVFLFLTLGINDVSPWLSLGASIIIAGSYLLEASDRGPSWTRY